MTLFAIIFTYFGISFLVGLINTFLIVRHAYLRQNVTFINVKSCRHQKQFVELFNDFHSNLFIGAVLETIADYAINWPKIAYSAIKDELNDISDNWQ